LKAPTPLDLGYISGDLADFSSINRPLRAVKGTEERDKLLVYLNRRFDKSVNTMNKVIHLVYLTKSTHAAGLRIKLFLNKRALAWG
jgi:hypothetical protein